MKTRTKRVFVLLLGAFILLVGGAIWILRPAPSLYAKSRRLLFNTSRYAWQSADVLFTFEEVKHGDDDENAKVLAHATDIRTGQVNPEPALNALLAEQGVTALTLCVFSADGSRMVGQAKFKSYSWWERDIELTDLAGDHPKFCKLNRDDDLASSEGSSFVWLPDGQRICKTNTRGQSGGGVMISAESPGQRGARINITNPGDALGVTRDNLLVIANLKENGYEASPVGISTLGLYPNPSPEKQRVIGPPPVQDVLEITLSPDGKRLAWLTSGVRSAPFYPLLQKISPKLASRFGPKRHVSIYVSRLDGSDMHLVATDPGKDPEHDPKDICWRPGSKELSFESYDSIYLLGVPE